MVSAAGDVKQRAVQPRAAQFVPQAHAVASFGGERRATQPRPLWDRMMGRS
jgi:hypothetical protein